MHVPEKFKDKTEVRGDCVVWTAAKDEDGYGRVRDGKKVVAAHRLAWETAFPEIPIGDMCVATNPEKCVTGPSCVNPDHLGLYTKQEVLLRSPDTESGKHKRQMRCKRGHPFTIDNTYIYQGERRCRRCQNERRGLERKLQKLED